MGHIGEQIKKRREELNMTQQELADKMGYKSRSTINKVELGINDIAQTTIYKYAEALFTTPSVLMGWDEAEPSEDNAALLADLMHDATLLSYVGKINSLDDAKKQSVYQYIDFISQ